MIEFGKFFMAIIHKIGWHAASFMAERLSTYHMRRLAALFAERSRPKIERQSYDCPLCEYNGPMNPFFGSTAMRFDAQCPQCDSRERHRFLKFWMDEDPRGAKFGDMLHFAPEPELVDLLRTRSKSYRTADITPGRANLVLNIEAIDLPDKSIDTVMANHVLEHVNDSKALAEIRRILRPGGLAVLTIPITASWEESYENPAIKGNAERFRHFSQKDHVRYFGNDIKSRVYDAGLNLDLIVADGPTSAKYALIPGDTIFLASRPAQ